MTTSSKIKIFLIIFFIAIFTIIAARHFVGLHFKKKFSERPPPGVVVNIVKKSSFYKSIETFGTAIAQNTKSYRVKTTDILGKLDIDNRFVKKGEIILKLQDGTNIVADFDGKLGKREIAQGVLGSESLIVTLDDLKKVVIDIKIPENYVGVLRPGLKAEVTSSAFNKRERLNFKKIGNDSELLLITSSGVLYEGTTIILNLSGVKTVFTLLKR